MKWLIVGATEGELEAVPRRHPAVVSTVVTGAGKTAAAVSTAAALARLPDLGAVRVLNVGTAGGLHDGPRLLRPSQAWAWDLDAASLSLLGIPVRDRLPLDGGDGSVVATGDTFVDRDDLRRELGAHACMVDMEAYAVAAACHFFGVPVEAIKWISDGADDRAAQDWSRGVRDGADAVRTALLAVLDGTPTTGVS